MGSGREDSDAAKRTLWVVNREYVMKSHCANTNRIMVRYFNILLVSVMILIVWWEISIKNHIVNKECIVESQQEQSFTAWDSSITGIGITSDNVTKDVFSRYDLGDINGTIQILDADGNVVWEKHIENYSLSSLNIGMDHSLVDSDIRLTDGEKYYLRLANDGGESIDGITWSLYGGPQNFMLFYILICTTVLLLGSLLYFQHEGRIRIPFEALLFILLFGTSVISMFAMVPLSVPDEELHFGNAVAMSNSMMKAIPSLRASAEYLPSGVLRLEGFGDAQYLSHFWSNWSYGNISVKAANDYYLAGSMPHYSYAVSAIGITVARILNASYQFYVIAARLANVLLYYIVIIITVKINPSWKNAVLALSFLPSALWLIDSCSYDVWNLAFCILAISYCDRLSKQNKVKMNELLIALVLFVAVIPIKFVYFNLIAAILFIKPERFEIKNRKQFMILCLVFVIISVCTVFVARGDEVIAFLGKGGFDTRSGIILDEKYTLSYVIRHPWYTALVYIKTCFVSGEALLKNTFLGDNFSSYIPDALAAMEIVLFIVIMGASFGDDVNTRRKRGLSWFMVLSGIVIIFSSFLFVYSKRGVSNNDIGTIAGLQGRYFVPYLILVPFLFRKRISGLSEKGITGLNYLMIFLTMVSIITRFSSLTLQV